MTLTGLSLQRCGRIPHAPDNTNAAALGMPPSRFCRATATTGSIAKRRGTSVSRCKTTRPDSPAITPTSLTESDMADLPNLAGVATAELVETIGGGNFKASYINWSRTLNLLRTHAPGWLPELVPTAGGEILHTAPQGAFLLIRFRHLDGTVTPEVPQAIMDPRNAAIPFAKVTARDITDTHRRGVCMAAALTFGLAYELWAKVALESGYAEAALETDDRPAAQESRRSKCEELCEEYAESVAAIKEGLDNGDLVKAAEAWFELDQDVMRGLWVAPTKGGPFTTKQREQMKSSEFAKLNPKTQKEAA